MQLNLDSTLQFNARGRQIFQLLGPARYAFRAGVFSLVDGFGKITLVVVFLRFLHLAWVSIEPPQVIRAAAADVRRIAVVSRDGILFYAAGAIFRAVETHMKMVFMSIPRTDFSKP